MKQRSRLCGGLRRQRGAALFIAMFLAAIAALTILVSRMTAVTQKTTQLAVAANAQGDAKGALLGYARTNGSPNFWGLLPLPDMGKRDASAHVEGEAPANFTADAARNLLANDEDALLIGRLPYKSLGTPVFRDDSGNCLWYAVSAAFKASNSGVPTFNWDTLGDFETGRSSNPHDSRAVALVFGPGIPVAPQLRAPNGMDSVNECGGNYLASDYLENLAIHPDVLNLPANAIPDGNQAVYILPPPQTSPTNPPAAAITIPFNSGTVAGNDQVVAISSSEIFQQIASAGKIQTSIGALLPLLKSCLEAKSLPNIGVNLLNSVPAGQSRYIGPLAPNGTAANEIDCLLTIKDDDAKELARWRDNFWYLTCNSPSSDCLTLTDTTGIQPPQSCDGLIAFSGARATVQRRSNPAEKSDPEQYFEIDPADPNSPDIVNAFRPVTVTTVKARSTLSAKLDELSQDVALCLKRPSSASNPDVDVVAFVDTPPGIGGEQVVSRDTGTDEITLGNPGLTGSAVGATFSDAVPVLGNVVKANNAELILPPTASAIDGTYAGKPVEILSGPGAGQTRTITAYNGASKTATLNSPWTSLPSASSVFRIETFTDNVVAANNPQVALPAGASSQSGAYVGFAVEITAGAGVGQSRVITAYDGPTRVATVDPVWDSLPDTSSEFRIDLGMPPFGKGIRVYFRAKILDLGDGFVFALFDADRNLDSNGVPTAQVSGGAGSSGQYLGYAGRNLDSLDNLIVPPIEFPKIGLEFDTVRNYVGAVDVNDTTGNHIALVYWGRSHDWPDPQPISPYEDDNTHAIPSQPQAGYPDPFAASACGSAQCVNLRDLSAINRDFHVRFEIDRQYPFSTHVGRYISRLWIVRAVDGMIPGMDNLQQDFASISSLPAQHSQSVDLTDLVLGVQAFRHFRFGFTNAQSPLRNQEVTISGLKLRLR